MSTPWMFPPEVGGDGDRDQWATPRALGLALVDEFGLTLDVAAQPSTALCPRFFTPADDGLVCPWDEPAWCNPPYSDPTPWVDRAIATARDGGRVVMLLPERIGVRWFTKLATHSQWWIFSERLEFTPPPGVKASRNNFGSVLAHFDGAPARCAGVRDISGRIIARY